MVNGMTWMDEHWTIGLSIYLTKPFERFPSFVIYYDYKVQTLFFPPVFGPLRMYIMDKPPIRDARYFYPASSSLYEDHATPPSIRLLGRYFYLFLLSSIILFCFHKVLLSCNNWRMGPLNASLGFRWACMQGPDEYVGRASFFSPYSRCMSV